MKLTRETEQSLRLVIKEAEPALKELKKRLEEDLGGKQIPSSVLYKNVFQALVHLDVIKSTIMLQDEENLNIGNKKQGKLF